MAQAGGQRPEATCVGAGHRPTRPPPVTSIIGRVPQSSQAASVPPVWQQGRAEWPEPVPDVETRTMVMATAPDVWLGPCQAHRPGAHVADG